MRTNNRKKLIGAAAVAGIVAASGSAFTATGVTTTGQAASAQFVGGTVSQAVSGATLNDIAYGFTDGTNTAINQVTLTFAADALGKHVAIALSGNGASTSSCTDVAGTGPYTSVCTVTDYTGATGIDVTVS